MTVTFATAELNPDVYDRAADQVEASWYRGGGPAAPGCKCAFTGISAELHGLNLQYMEDDYINALVYILDLPHSARYAEWALVGLSDSPYDQVFEWNDAAPNAKFVADHMRSVGTYLRRIQGADCN